MTEQPRLKPTTFVVWVARFDGRRLAAIEASGQAFERPRGVLMFLQVFFGLLIALVKMERKR
jgi:hypothetical protein